MCARRCQCYWKTIPLTQFDFGHVCDMWARAVNRVLRSYNNVKGKAMDIGPHACRVAWLAVSNILRACVSWAYTWACVFFRAKSSDLLHMGVYTGMGVITGEYGMWVVLATLHRLLVTVNN